jgi:hypothetical protein
MSGADPDIVSGLKIHISFKNDLRGRHLRKSLFEISEGEAGIGFGEFAFNKMDRPSVVITPAIKYVKAVIPAQAGIQKGTGCPRLATYRGRLIKSGMTY